jgi:hypothetical protein
VRGVSRFMRLTESARGIARGECCLAGGLPGRMCGRHGHVCTGLIGRWWVEPGVGARLVGGCRQWAFVPDKAVRQESRLVRSCLAWVGVKPASISFSNASTWPRN